MPRNVIVIGHEIWLRLFAEKFVLKVKLCGVDKIQGFCAILFFISILILGHFDTYPY